MNANTQLTAIIKNPYYSLVKCQKIYNPSEAHILNQPILKKTQMSITQETKASELVADM